MNSISNTFNPSLTEIIAWFRRQLHGDPLGNATATLVQRNIEFHGSTEFDVIRGLGVLVWQEVVTVEKQIAIEEVRGDETPTVIQAADNTGATAICSI